MYVGRYVAPHWDLVETLPISCFLEKLQGSQKRGLRTATDKTMAAVNEEMTRAADCGTKSSWMKCDFPWSKGPIMINVGGGSFFYCNRKVSPLKYFRKFPTGWTDSMECYY